MYIRVGGRQSVSVLIETLYKLGKKLIQWKYMWVVAVLYQNAELNSEIFVLNTKILLVHYTEYTQSHQKRGVIFSRF